MCVGGCPVMVLGQGQLRPPSSPVSSRLAAGGSGGGWAQGPVGLGVLFPTTPPCPPGAPHSPGLKDPGRAGQLIFRQWGQVACSGLPGLIPWSHPPPQQAGSAPRLPSRANQMPPCPTTVPRLLPWGPQGPQPVPPPPPIMWSPESLSTNCGPELRVSQSWGSDRGGVMEQVCCEETVLPCRSQGQAGTGVVTVGHGAWEV